MISSFNLDCHFFLQLSEISSATSVLPGTLVQGLITSVHTSGLNLQVLGYFDGTIDQYHIGEESSSFKIGQKVKARIIYDHLSSPPRFALSCMAHVTRLTPRFICGGETERSVCEAYPVGTILEAVKVIRVEPERGLTAEISENVQGFVHVSSPMTLHLCHLMCPSDFSSFRRPSAIIDQHWSLETWNPTCCPCNWLLRFRWPPETILEAFYHSAEIFPSDRCQCRRNC